MVRANELRNDRMTFRLSATERDKLNALATATKRKPSEVLRLLLALAVSDGRPDLWLGQRSAAGR